MKILILGVTGMIGSSIYREFLISKKCITYGTYKDHKKINFLKKKNKLFYFNVFKKTDLKSIVKDIRPNIVINCIGLTKHLDIKDNKKIIKINSDFPHYAKKISNKFNAKFIQISTDCVFNGKKGNYKEYSKPNAVDLYGISKARGEINDKTNLTIRTSTFGHELFTNYGLLNWFLGQNLICNGYSKAIFNGFPTFYFAKILEKIILKNITGILHISGNKIDKYTLLKKINKIYKKNIIIKKNVSVKIDRSLNNKLLKTELAQMLGVNNPELARLLNENIGMNFFEYVNYYRIKEFVFLAKTEKAKQLTFFGLAQEAGFNSKTTFNKSFKKLMGVSPSAYFDKKL